MAPPPNDTNSHGAKAPATLQTVNLRVYIHCEGCRRKVKKILYQVEGVDTVDVDRKLGKVTVTGFVDSKVLLNKLEKAGKAAEVLNGSGGGAANGKEHQKNESKAEKAGKAAEVLNGSGGGAANGKEQKKSESKAEKVPKKVRFAETGEDKKSKGGDAAEANRAGDKKDNNSGGNNKSISANNGVTTAADIEGKGKKKSSDDVTFDEMAQSRSLGHKSVTPMMIETGYSIGPVEYATHMFSDENTDSCHIM